MPNTEAAVAMSKSGLFSKVSLLLTGSLLITAFGAHVGAGIHSTGAIIALALLFIFGSIGVKLAARSSKEAGLVALSIWTFISGLFLGPFVHHYMTTIGPATVFLAFLGTGGVMAVCGVFGAAMSLTQAAKLSRIAMMLLLGLIVACIISMFVAFSSAATVVLSLLGIAAGSICFLVDFFRLANEDDNWENAFDITMNLYLDFLIVFEWILRLLGVAVGDD